MTDTPQNKPNLLHHETAKKLDLLQRYWVTYKRSYHSLLWALEENELLLRFNKCTHYNTQQLNEALYGYTQSSISALCWLKKENKDFPFPFVHKFLREWRNTNHHDERTDFSVNEARFNVKENLHELPLGYNVLPLIVINKKLKKLTKEEFSLETIATDATLRDLVLNHDTYMRSIFSEYDSNLKLPSRFLQPSSNPHAIFGGGRYDQFISKENFWKGKAGL